MSDNRLKWKASYESKDEGRRQETWGDRGGERRGGQGDCEERVGKERKVERREERGMERRKRANFLVETGVDASLVAMATGTAGAGAAVSCLGVASVLRGTSLRFCS